MAGNFPRVFLQKKETGGVGWPLILAIVITVVGAGSFVAAIYYFKKKYELSWSICTKKEVDIRDEVVEEVDLDSRSSSVA